MKVSASKISRRYFAPEVVQTSAMDCGPAALKCLLEGFGIRVSYGRLREACQTDVDGTSIDTMEEIARQLGLDADQIMIPVDHLLLSEANALPAIVVVRQADGATHFVVAWRRHGGVLQIMDPGTGRRWPSTHFFLNELYVHTMAVSAAGWREWADSEEFIYPLQRRLANLGLAPRRSRGIIDAALVDTSWHSLAALDAATRMVDALIRSDGIKAGPQAGHVLERFFEKSVQESSSENRAIPNAYWSVRPSPSAGASAEQLLLRGAVLVRALRPLPHNGVDAAPGDAATPAQNKTLSPELAAALEEAPLRPDRELFRLIFQDGWKTPALMIAALFATAVAFILEALVLRSLMEVWEVLSLPSQRAGAMVILLIFALALLLLQVPNISNYWRFGRRLELRLRMAFLKKIPRLADRYFQSRPISDMVQRSHVVYHLSEMPNIYANLLRAIFELLLTAAGIAWIDPPSAPLAFLAAALVIALPLMTLPLLMEKDSRLQTHSGALGRFYLDALLGLVPIRSHGAERAVRTEHEGLLVEWARSSLSRHRMLAMLDGLLAISGYALAAWILFSYLARTAEVNWVLLMAYWTLNLPVLGQGVAQVMQQYPAHRNIILRLLEPLGAPEEGETASTSPSTQIHKEKTHGVALALQQVSVRVAGHTILQDIDFTITSGSHTAIVGPSGAGKSSLVGVFLGWHRPAAGKVLVDGEALAGERLDQLRQETAWADPAVHLWNRSLFDNLHYGNENQHAAALGMVIEQAELIGVLQKLPEGLQTPLGEGGRLVSGGEGQRVRLGRAMLRGNARLAILDEPFRGLDRQQRRTLLARCRELWKNATLLCITHDVGETLEFDRVSVIENGQVIEDGIPMELAKRADSRYRQLLEAENAVREKLWSSQRWRKVWLGTQPAIE